MFIEKNGIDSFLLNNEKNLQPNCMRKFTAKLYLTMIF